MCLYYPCISCNTFIFSQHVVNYIAIDIVALLDVRWVTYISLDGLVFSLVILNHIFVPLFVDFVVHWFSQCPMCFRFSLFTSMILCCYMIVFKMSATSILFCFSLMFYDFLCMSLIFLNLLSCSVFFFQIVIFFIDFLPLPLLLFAFHGWSLIFVDFDMFLVVS